MAGFVGGGFQVITVILAIDVLQAGEQANGFLNAAIGIGGLLGRDRRRRPRPAAGPGAPLIVGAVVTPASARSPWAWRGTCRWRCSGSA